MAEKNKILNGSENVLWDLSELFSSHDDPLIPQHLEKCKNVSKLFQDKYKNRVVDLIDSELEMAYREMINFFSKMVQISQFANLLLSSKTSDNNAKQLVSRVEEAFSEVSNNTVFFDLELAKLSDEKFELFQVSSSLQDHLYRISRTRDMEKYQLSEDEEKTLNLKNITGKSAFKRLFGELSSSFEFEFAENGEIKQYTGAQLRSLRYHHDKDIRARAMKTFFAKYEENKIVFTSIFNSILKDYNISKKLRSYKTPISIRNMVNDLNDDVISMVVDVTTASYPLVHRYYKLKKKLLGLDTLKLADIYAPLPETNEKFSWNESKELVLDAFESFDGEFYKYAKLMFDQNRIDAPSRKNKRGGAFCSSSTPDLNPYILLNFNGKIRDVATMAHELGHAIHAMYSNKQHILNYHPILPLAETASVFSEMILTDQLLNKYDDDNQFKISLISSKLEDIFSTSHRQNMFTRFEIEAHNRIEKNLLSSEDFCEIYQNELENMFGDSVEYQPEYRWEWSAIPHMINVPFYVYSYNFANLIVMALYHQFLEEKDIFIPKFKQFLSMGGSAKPTTIIGIMGQDINKREFWQKGVIYIESLIDKLEIMVNNTGNE